MSSVRHHHCFGWYVASRLASDYGGAQFSLKYKWPLPLSLDWLQCGYMYYSRTTTCVTTELFKPH